MPLAVDYDNDYLYSVDIIAVVQARWLFEKGTEKNEVTFCPFLSLSPTLFLVYGEAKGRSYFNLWPPKIELFSYGSLWNVKLDRREWCTLC